MTEQLLNNESSDHKEGKRVTNPHPVMNAKGILLKATEAGEMPEFLDVEQDFSFEYWDIRDLMKWVDYITPRPSSIDDESNFMLGNFTFGFFYPEDCKLSPEEFLAVEVETLKSDLHPDYYYWTAYMMHED
jgi:hypothetical protein